MKCIYAAQPMFLCFLICFFTFSCLRNTPQKHLLTCDNVFRYFVLIFTDREKIHPLSHRVAPPERVRNTYMTHQQNGA